MSTLFFIFILLSVYHFVVETLILPVLKDTVKFKLFALRDKLATVKIGETEVSGTALQDLKLAINLTCHNINQFNLFEAKWHLNQIKKDQKVKEQINNDIELIKKSPELERYFDKFNKYVFYIFFINMGAWIIYILPFTLTYSICKFLITGTMYNTRKNQEDNLTYVFTGKNQPGPELYKVGEKYSRLAKSNSTTNLNVLNV